MTQKGKVSQDRILEAANQLFYTQGYNPTSLADVAEEVGITKGNLHYHYRSKDELLEAVIDHRLAGIRETLQQWEQTCAEPRARLKHFVQMVMNERAGIIRYGCPMGSLNVELGKAQQPLQAQARAMFDLFQVWLQETFKQMGCSNSKALSLHLLAMAQGAALMSYVYADAGLLKRECQTIDEWIDKLEADA